MGTWIEPDWISLQVLAERLDNLLFGDYTVPDLLQEERTYREVTDISQLDQVVASYIVDYNNTNKTRLNLILFQWFIYISTR